MNQRLSIALNSLKRLSDDRQSDAAAILEAFVAQDAPRAAWTAEQVAEIRTGLAEATRGEFATDEEMSALFNRFRG